jgi:Domain of unknown function (DUF4157)/Novel toxin 16
MSAAALQFVPHSAPAMKQVKTAPPPAPLRLAPVITAPLVQRQAQCACGGDCPRCEAATRQEAAIQTKLTVSTPGDEYEQEADLMAEHVMRMHDPVTSYRAVAARPSGTHLQRKCSACERIPGNAVLAEEEEEALQTKGQEGQAATARLTPEVQSQIEELRGGGRPLSESERAFFEPRFGRDFSQVRLHTDGRAAQAAQAVSAQAYTIGRDIVFGAGRYQPETTEGNRLLAHELTHVIQQGASHLPRQRIHRVENSPGTVPTETAPQQPASPTARLLSLIDRIEQVHARASQAVSGSQTPVADASGAGATVAGLAGSVAMIPSLLNQLRAVASGDDEALKLQVLAGFSPENIREATDRVERTHKSAQAIPVSVQEEAPESMAASPLHLSHPQDAAEREAVNVAEAVISGRHFAVGQTAHDRVIHRSNGAAAALAGLIAFETAGGAEAEIATGPPGWVVGAVAVVAIAGLAIYVAATTPSTTTTIPTTTTVPTTTTTTAAPPITATRSRPNQTCDDARLTVLEGAKDIACRGPFTCSDKAENLGKKNQRLFACAELLANIAAINGCLAARNLIQSECFTGSPEAGHQAQVAQLTNALATCTAKAIARGCMAAP